VQALKNPFPILKKYSLCLTCFFLAKLYKMHCHLEIREDMLLFFQLAMSSKHPKEEKNSAEQMVKPFTKTNHKTIFF
jgi:hypothetical protein